ncbi:MAG TPA: glycosyltransferase [Solirubrobacteraceae bacterium]|jgi:GT2 family glycosyltransferase|nr:glycosyltransferase [Solirubrobacteraceae bacterium]
MISLCTAVYRAHAAPDVAGLAGTLSAALDGHPGELVVALNGVEAGAVGVPDGVATVAMGANRGVAPAWNAAARAASGDLLVFCNDDVELGPASLRRLADALLSRPDTGVVGPVGSRWDIAEARHVAWVGPGRTPGELAPCEVVSGFLFACRRATWERVGGFDEFYAPASWEEVDFCTAVRAEGGRCYAVAGVDCRHEWGVSRRQPPWARAHWDGRSETWRSVHRRNRRHFLEKWGTHPVARAAVDSAIA